MNWKYFVKGILKGIQTPFFNVGSLFEEIINSVEDEKNNQWQDSVDAILKKIEQETLQKFNHMESEMQFLILSQIPGCFSEKQNIKLNEIIKQIQNDMTENDRFQSTNILLKELFSIMQEASDEMFNTWIRNQLVFTNSEIVKIKNRLIANTPLSVPLLKYLGKSVKKCSDKNVPYQTPNLLLALFSKQDSILLRAFNEAEKDLGNKYLYKIKKYIDTEQQILNMENDFVSFDWMELESVKNAQQEAYCDNSPIIMEKHLALGVLKSTNSNTINIIKNNLDMKYDEIINYIDNQPAFRLKGTLITEL